MSLSNKISEIVEFIFKNYGIKENFPIKSKLLIHDNVFGTLRFTDYERKIINSPFLQRLTQVHQMGLAYFVYPGAVHNRFSHSLGVSYLSEKVYSTLIKIDVNRNEDKFKEDVNTLKLAGLLHDIGHGPFSHVSDDIIKTLTHFSDIPLASIDNQICSSSGIHSEHKNPHEFLGFHLLKSDQLRILIDDIYETVSLDFDLIPLCITGNLIPFENGKVNTNFDDKYKTLLIKIINGFSDVDKMDYLLRDSKFSGLPLPADIDRLISFFEIISDNGSYELGVSEKGTRAFNLLLQSKAKMYPTVYQHHTTSACESLLEFGVIDAIRNVEKATENINQQKYPPIKCGVDLLYYTDISLFEYLRLIDNPISNDVIKRLNKRKHYRILRRVYTWELRKEFIMERKYYRELLKSQNKYAEIQQLINKGKKAESKLRFELNYYSYEANIENKISDFYKEFDTREKMLRFKEKIIKKEPEILNKLKRNLPGVDEETLIDYAICIRIAGTLSPKPYNQPYVNRFNRFKDEYELLSLSQMGFVEPQALDYQHITFYALPDFVDKLKPYIYNYLKKKFG